MVLLVLWQARELIVMPYLLRALLLATKNQSCTQIQSSKQGAGGTNYIMQELIRPYELLW